VKFVADERLVTVLNVVAFAMFSDIEVCAAGDGRGTNQSRQRDLRHVHHA